MPYDPFWMFRSPFSGAVSQRINSPWFSPVLTVNYAGNAAIEDQVVTQVASYGKQIGWINEIVLALAENRVPSSETVGRMREASKEIEMIKAKHKQSALSAAIEALDQLQTDHPTEYHALPRARGE